MLCATWSYQCTPLQCVFVFSLCIRLKVLLCCVQTQVNDGKWLLGNSAVKVFPLLQPLWLLWLNDQGKAKVAQEYLCKQATKICRPQLSCQVHVWIGMWRTLIFWFFSDFIYLPTLRLMYLLALNYRFLTSFWKRQTIPNNICISYFFMK